MKKLVVIGAGPAGLGAAFRLKELKYNIFSIYEKNDYIGGLAASFKDESGFTWDIGGHIFFSHYDYFSKLLGKFLKGECLFHERKSYIRLMDSWVPYPFQNNLRHLPPKITQKCLDGLLKCRKNDKSPNFLKWIHNTFGRGIARYFMVPYNEKVWAYPLDKMSYGWIGDRVSVVDKKRAIENVALKRDDVSWGPNNKFMFPLKGGTGGFFNKFYPRIKDNLQLNKELIKVNINKKELTFKDGLKDKYDVLISTIPLNELAAIITPSDPAIAKASRDLEYNGIYVAGLGFNKPMKVNRCWVYFPENKAPFYRMTYFSNYSPDNVPGGRVDKYSSLMCEVAFSTHKKINEKEVIKKTIEGLINTGIISPKDKKNIISKYLYKVPYAYPIPTLKRDNALKIIQKYLLKNNIYSRGRFGAWKYEVGNMDHSVMQGKEAVDKILKNTPEKVWSL